MKRPDARIHVHEDAGAMGDAVAKEIALLAKQAIAGRGVFRLALAGGQTPRRCYEALARLDVDWAHVQVYFGDERCLPQGNANRNDSMVRDALLDHIAIPDENIHAMRAELGAEEAAARYMLVLNGVNLDLVLLGMGEDGHTASLFPGSKESASEAAVVAVYDAPKPPAERVSLGMNTLNAARSKWFMVAGEGKRSALERILLGEMLPAAKITGAVWHVDHAVFPTSTGEEKCR